MKQTGSRKGAQHPALSNTHNSWHSVRQVAVSKIGIVLHGVQNEYQRTNSIAGISCYLKVLDATKHVADDSCLSARECTHKTVHCGPQYRPTAVELIAVKISLLLSYSPPAESETYPVQGSGNISLHINTPI